jgi:hypothetical protein
MKITKSNARFYDSGYRSCSGSLIPIPDMLEYLYTCPDQHKNDINKLRLYVANYEGCMAAMPRDMEALYTYFIRHPDVLRDALRALSGIVVEHSARPLPAAAFSRYLDKKERALMLVNRRIS